MLEPECDADCEGSEQCETASPLDVPSLPDDQLTALLKSIPEHLRAGNTGAAAHSFDTLVALGSCPPDSTCEKLLKALTTDVHQFKVGWHVYLVSKSEGVLLRYSAHQAVLTAATRAKEYNSALVVFQAMKAAGWQPNVITYCAIISSLARSKKPAFLRTGRRLWAELRASGLPLDVTAFRTGANICVECGDLPAAQGVMGEMRAAGVPPDTQAYNIMIKGYAREGMLSQLPNLVADMQVEGLQLNRVSYTTLVEAYVEAGQLGTAESWAAAAAVSNAAQSGEAGDWLRTALLKGEVQAGDLSAAEAQLQRMIERGCPPLPAWAHLIDGYVHANQLKDARQVIARMQQADVPVNVQCWNMLLRGYADRGRTGRNGVSWCMKHMAASGMGPDASSYNTLMAAAVRHGDSHAALAHYQQLQSTNTPPDVVTFTILMKAHCLMRNTAKVIEVFHHLDVESSDQVDVVALSVYIDALCKAGLMRQASQLLKRANNLAASSGQPPPLAAHGAVMSGHARRRDFASATKALQRFVDAGGNPNSRMYNTLVDIAMRTGDYKKALQVVRKMEKRGHSLDRSRFKNLFAELCRQEESQAHARTHITSGTRFSSASGDVPKDVPNEALERFKWLLGLKNVYYSQH